MNTRVETLLAQARGMTQEERIWALDALQEMLLPPNDNWQKNWVLEASARVDAYQKGETEAEDFDLVMERLRKEFLHT